MQPEQIHTLIQEGQFPEGEGKGELVETHISWVLLHPRYTYKIKKPVQYSFLDFSSIEKRKHYCQREIILNQRLTDKIYVDVLPVRDDNGNWRIGQGGGRIMDYAVRMHTQDRDRQMDRLLKRDQVSFGDIDRLAEKIAQFHLQADVVRNSDPLSIGEKFNDLQSVSGFVRSSPAAEYAERINDAVRQSDAYLKRSSALLQARMANGYFRDGHGDLHSRNIFLLPSPEPFDCIEFNDAYRQLDVLDDIAFLCMDLEALKHSGLAKRFLETYNRVNTDPFGPDENRLFTYYKSYRANIRAKVNLLRARSVSEGSEQEKFLQIAIDYLKLMSSYLEKL